MATTSESSFFQSFSSKKSCLTFEQSEVGNHLLYKVESQMGKRPSDEDLSNIFNQTFEIAPFEQTATYFFDREFQITPTTFHRLLRLIKRKDRLYLSFFLSNKYEKTSAGQQIKNSYFYSSIIIHGTKKNKFYSIAKKAFEEAKKRNEANVYVYSDFMYVAKENNNLEDAINAYNEAKKRSLTNRITHNIAIDILLKLGRPEEAKGIFDKHILPSLSDNFEVFDLHDLSHGAAKCFIDHILKTGKKNQKIRIITGRGSHSKSNELSEMRNLCRDYIEKNSSVCKIIKVSKGFIDLEISK